jgi:hypothetical protein
MMAHISPIYPNFEICLEHINESAVYTAQVATDGYTPARVGVI